MTRATTPTGIRWHAIVPAIGLAALVTVVAGPGCGGAPGNGTLCASCGDQTDVPCATAIIPDQDLGLFCGSAGKDQCEVCSRDVNDVDKDGSTGNFICQTEQTCTHPRDSAAQVCYPVKFGTTDPLASFTCDGIPPA